MFRESLRSGLRVWAATPDCRDSAVGLDHVALAAEQKRLLSVANQQQRLEMPKKLVRTPVARQFDGGPPEVAMILLQLSLNRLKSVNASAVDPAKPATILSL